MEGITQWLVENWVGILGISYVADKLVKATPTKYDDLVVDVLVGAVKKMAGKGK
jgi:hypothetical protein